MPVRSTPEKFLSKCRNSENGCIEWIGYRQKDGYGQLIYQGKQELAHRLAYRLSIGVIPHEMCICHKCDNPSCCNPDHLFIGTQLDNIADRVAKGRNGCRKGETNGRAKLTESMVLEIREKLSSGSMTKAAIGRKYGVSEVLIGMIARRKVWRHV